MAKLFSLSSLIIFLFIILCAKSLADDLGNFSENAKGWYWHDSLKQENTEDKDESENDPVSQMNSIKASIERAQDQMVLHPNKDNVKNYINIQNQVAENSEKVKRYWQAVLLENPELDYSLKHPTNNLAKRVESDQEKQKEDAIIRELAQKSGLFFFYRSSCPYCVRFAPIVKDFSESYGITVIPITTDGIALPEFPNSYKDQGQAEKFKVTVEPALFAVNPYTHKAFPVAYGLTSVADLKKRLLDIATQFGGDVR